MELRHQSITPAYEAQESLGKMGQKDSKSLMIRDFAVGLYLLAMSEATPIKPHQHGYPNMN